ncbi:MAG: hypothetical protein KF773_13385 [Deltaproteobacteria bacterium]|nr:hypothetical protein [Deltaproteobacteria bacterium]MCW5803377.1 hypothetical protein [Deltaproteobacteria bacterium]
MDSIFEEDADAVGGEIEAYCPSPRCKADTTHTIISMYEDEVRRVQCVVCGEVHAYRKPRGDGSEEAGEGGGKRASSKRMTWEDALARASDNDLNNCRPFSILDAYEEGDVVWHRQFDVGFVIGLLPDNKVEVVFNDGGSRILVHNRKDLASRMPDISEVPVPRDQKKKKRSKKGEAAPPQIAVRSKDEIAAALERAREAAHARSDEAQKTADERSKKLGADVKKQKTTKSAPPPPAAAAKGAVKPAKGAAPAAAAAKPAKGEKAPEKAPEKAEKAEKAAKGTVKAAKPAGKPAAPAKAAAKPAKAPAKPAKAAAKPAKKPAPAKKPPAKKPAPAKKPPAKKPAKKKK